MAITIELEHDEDGIGVTNLRMEFPAPVALDGPQVLAILGLLMGERRTHLMKDCRFWLISPLHYRVRFIMNDDATWIENWDFTLSASDPKVTINITPNWDYSLMAFQRPIRDAVLVMHQALGMAELHFEFTPGL